MNHELLLQVFILVTPHSASYIQMRIGQGNGNSSSKNAFSKTARKLEHAFCEIMHALLDLQVWITFFHREDVGKTLKFLV